MSYNRSRCGRGISMTVEVCDRSSRGISMTVADKTDIGETSISRRQRETISRLGSTVQIIRDGAVMVTTKAILSPLQRISTPKTLAVLREGYFSISEDVQGGDYIFEIDSGTYFVFLTKNEFRAENDLVGINSLVARCNRVAAIYSIVNKPTGAGGVRQVFEQTRTNIPISIEFIRGDVRAEQPGLFLNSTHRAFIPVYWNITELDRIKVGEDYLRVDAIDRITYDNVIQIVLSVDRRPA